MKDKNLPDDIKAKSLDELREILNSLLTKIETSPNLENSADDYQKLIKVNNLIEKKFQSLSKEISNNSKSKIDEMLLISLGGPVGPHRVFFQIWVGDRICREWSCTWGGPGNKPRMQWEKGEGVSTRTRG